MPDRGHVYILDSDPESVSVLGTLLRDSAYHVDTATGGDGAFERIIDVNPNVVLQGVDLPDLDSFALCERLKRDPRTQYIPVILMPLADDPESRVKCVELGDDLITKPFEAREVLARVERQVTVSKVRAALSESEAKFRSVMESAIDAIISGDSRGNIRSWNSAAVALFGFTEDEVIGKPIDLIIPDRFREQHRAGVRRVSSGGASNVIGKTVELAAVRKDGSEFPVELSLATWFLHDERYYTGIIRDISERKQAEQKFRSVTEAAIDAIISADQRGVIVSWNNAATRILGYSAEDAIGQPLELIIPHRFHDAHRTGMDRVTAGGESRVIGTTVELFARAASGEELPIELSLSTWTVKDDRYYTGIIRDIRERKQAEEALRKSEQALRESARELRRKNEALESTLRQLGETQNQLILQEKLVSLGRLSAGMAHELNNPAAAAQRGAVQLQTVFRQLQDAHLRLDPSKIGGDPVGTFTALDRRARERAESTLTQDALTRADDESALETWLEQRNVDDAWTLAPALVSLGYDVQELSELEKQCTPDQLPVLLEWVGCTHTIYSLLGAIGLGTGRITEIVKALKAYSYMDQAPIQSVDVHEGLDNTLVILRSKLRGGITVRREYAEDLPAIEAHGSELNQVWTNIIDNAIDAMGGRGTLVLRTRTEASWVVVEIEDDGNGIPEEIQSDIFDPFFTTKPPGEGTGLGLNISRNLVVHRHRGEISVSSAPGRTCFSIRLPLQLSVEEPAAGGDNQS